MYLPKGIVSAQDEIELVCPTTGESYVYIDREKLSPEQQAQAIERLPNRFFQRPYMVKNPDGSMRVILKQLPGSV